MTDSNNDNDTRTAGSRSARERVLAVAQELTSRRSRPYARTALAAQANVNLSTVKRMRPQLEEEFPGLLWVRPGAGTGCGRRRSPMGGQDR